jgi:hypothetical protein
MGYRTSERDRAVSQQRSCAQAFDPTLADSDGVEAFDRLLQAAFGVPILILRGAQECQIKNQPYGFHLGGRCAR